MDSNVTICIDKASSQITSRLHVKNVAWKNRGPVRCVANSINGEASKTGMLNVHGKKFHEKSHAFPHFQKS